MTFSADDLDESNARQIEKHTVPGFEYCGLGVCSAEGGHEGTCAQASGWDDEDA